MSSNVVIAFLNQKGGVGKTTLAVNVAGQLARRKHPPAQPPVLIIDADPQGSALDWSQARPAERQALPVVGLPKPTLHRDLKALVGQFEHIVIDGPPRVAEVVRSIILASDVIAIPVQPSPLDIWSAHEILELIREAQAFKENLVCRFVVNRKHPGTVIGRQVVEALSQYEIPVAKTHVVHRVIYAEAMAQGLLAAETDPKGVAAQEIKNLTQELLATLNHG